MTGQPDLPLSSTPLTILDELKSLTAIRPAPAHGLAVTAVAVVDALDNHSLLLAALERWEVLAAWDEAGVAQPLTVDALLGELREHEEALDLLVSLREHAESLKQINLIMRRLRKALA